MYLTAPDLLPWFSPVLAGLLLAVPLVVISSRAELGLAAFRRGWFLIPEEVAPPAELKWLYQDAPRHARVRRPDVGLLASQPVAPHS